jgi:hypothetical protein
MLMAFVHAEKSEVAVSDRNPHCHCVAFIVSS